MNTNKTGGIGKLVAFFAIAVAMLFAFGLVADGWQLFDPNEPDSGEDATEGNETDENTDGNQEPEIPEEPEVYIPEYTDPLTGLETTEESARYRPIAFVMNPQAPLYGISGADILAEIPVEGGETRLLAITSGKKKLGKIGSLAATRDYISNISKFFGAVIVSAGDDDKIEYSGCDVTSSSFDLSKQSGYSYTEYTHFHYTNDDLILAGLTNSGISTMNNAAISLPYRFLPFDAESPIIGTESARCATLQYSESSSTELYFSDDDGRYTLSKGGVIKKDMLNDKPLKFDNVFILFADTVTYENADGSSMIMNTVGGGVGYYLTGGTLTKISWESTLSGSMTFHTEDGQPLTVNRGTSYIGIKKSSKIADVKIS